MEIKLYRDNYYKIMKEIVEDLKSHGADTHDMRDYIKNRLGLLDKLEFLSEPHMYLQKKNEKMRKLDPLYKGIEFVGETHLKYSRIDAEVLVDLLNEYCKPTKVITGKAKLNGNLVDFMFMQEFKYELLTKENGYLAYGLTEKLTDEFGHKVNNITHSKFSVDLERKIITVS